MAGFSDLPAEVRNILYDNLLRDEAQRRHRAPSELALFTVSKQFHQEAASYFYENNNIAIDAPSPSTATGNILPPIANKYLRYLKRLTIHAKTGHPSMPDTTKVAITIAALSTIGARMNELTLIISSPLSQLLCSRVDDAVLDASHPITSALQTVLSSGTVKHVRIQLENAWLAPGVARTLQETASSRLQFFGANGILAHDLSELERSLTGRFSSTHLTTLGFDAAHVRATDCSAGSSPLSTPSSMTSSLSSAFSELDAFSVTSFELSSDEKEDVSMHDVSHDDTNGSEQPFFSEDDIEEWSASTEEEEQDGQALDERDDIDEDMDTEDVQDGETEAIMHNLQEAAHHVANSDDVTYMVNFAPELLLSRHHLGHLA